MNTFHVLIVTAALISVDSAQADIPAFVLGDVLMQQPSSFTGTKGWSFLRRGSGVDIAITHLGVFDSDGDGLTNPHEVGLWRGNSGNIGGTLLASAIIPAGTEAPLIGGYRYVEIPPVIIPYALGGYVVGAQYTNGDADDMTTPRPSADPRFGDLQFAPHIWATLGGFYGLGSDLPYPQYMTIPPCEGCIGEQFWEANFQYVVVPEPSLWLVAVPTLLIGLRRMRPPSPRS